MSEYTSRYEPVSHEELYQGVRAGDPEQVENLAADWNSLRDTLDGLSRDLDRDLDRLAGTWTGSAGQEYQRRLDLVVDYARTLRDGTVDLRQGLTLMAGQLRRARSEAESPEETDDHDQAISGAARGAVFGIGGVVVGGILGHQQDKAEQERAHQRMVQLVSGLAAGYDVSAYSRVVQPPPPPPDLPGALDDRPVTPLSGPSPGAPRSAPVSRRVDRPRGATVTPGTTAEGIDRPGGPAGVTGGGAPVGSPTPVDLFRPPGDPGTGLAGVGGPTGGTSLTTAGPLTGSTGSGSSLLPGVGAAVAVGGILGTGALAGSGRAPVPPATRPTGPPGGPEHRPATGTGRLATGRTGPEGGPANRSGAAGGQRAAVPAHRNGVLGGGRATGPEEDSDDRLTWLTEDEMVWGTDRPAVPPVLDGS